MAKEHTTGETSEVATVSMSERRLGILMLLVFLIVLGIGGMAMLCYRLENPSATQMIQDR